LLSQQAHLHSSRSFATEVEVEKEIITLCTFL